MPNSGGLIVPVAFDFCTALGLNLPLAFTGTIDANGVGSTPQFQFPSVPAGLAIFNAALTWNPGSGTFHAVSEPIQFVTR